VKPKPYVQLQAIALSLVTAIILGILADEAALTLAIALTVGLAIWGYFMLRYYWLLRHAAHDRSGDRAGKDAVMLGCLVGGLALSAGLSWVEYGLDGIDLVAPPLHGGAAVIAALSVIAVPLGILVSSSVDWYLIRPFREGVHGDPVCRPSQHENGRAMDYAKYWIMHRMTAEFVAYAGIVVVVGLALTIASEATHTIRGKSVLGFVGGIGIAVWSLSELSKLEAALRFVRFPTCDLGGWVKGRNDECEDISGFVLDVSVSPGVQLIDEPRGHPARDIAKATHSVPLKQLRTIDDIPSPRRLCAARCEFWVPDCEVGLRELEKAAPGSSD